MELHHFASVYTIGAIDLEMGRKTFPVDKLENVHFALRSVLTSPPSARAAALTLANVQILQDVSASLADIALFNSRAHLAGRSFRELQHRRTASMRENLRQVQDVAISFRAAAALDDPQWLIHNASAERLREIVDRATAGVSAAVVGTQA